MEESKDAEAAIFGVSVGAAQLVVWDREGAATLRGSAVE